MCYLIIIVFNNMIDHVSYDIISELY